MVFDNMDVVATPYLMRCISHGAGHGEGIIVIPPSSTMCRHYCLSPGVLTVRESSSAPNLGESLVKQASGMDMSSAMQWSSIG